LGNLVPAEVKLKEIVMLSARRSSICLYSCVRTCWFLLTWDEWQAYLWTTLTSHPPHSGHWWFMPFQQHAGSFSILHCVSHCIASLQ